jgi:hypothetical protein
MANHPNEDQEVLRAAIHQTQDLIDSIYAHSIGIVRLVGLEAPDVPRLCVSAACRTVELLMEKHARYVNAGNVPPKELALLRNTIVAAAADLVAVLGEATTAAARLAEFARNLDPANKTAGMQ